MFGPGPGTRGGIGSVVGLYQEAGISRALNIRFVPTYSDGSKWQKLAVYFRAAASLVVAASARRVRLVHLHTAVHTSFLRKASLAGICLVFRIPYIFHVHSGRFPEYICTTAGRFERGIARFILTRAARLIALTDGFGQSLRRDRRWMPPVSVIPNPAPMISDAYSHPPSQGRELRILFLGLFLKDKGIFDLLRAVSVLGESGVPVVVRCGGSGDTVALQRECAALHIEDRVHLLGWLDADDRMRELLAADVLVLPSYVEGQPMVIIEAMAAETPIIASRVGGVPETVVDGVEALLIEPGNVGELVSALRRLAGEPEWRKSLTKAAKARALRNHSPGVVCERLRDLYDSISPEN